MHETIARVGHPIAGVFMKCWRCQETRLLVHDGHRELHCPQCGEALIALEDR
jgi:predicted RNA-binding Zn-ribbon protein involved in translation (DUF1610 family)